MLQRDRVVLERCMIVCHGEMPGIARLRKKADVGEPQLFYQMLAIAAMLVRH